MQADPHQTETKNMVRILESGMLVRLFPRPKERVTCMHVDYHLQSPHKVGKGLVILESFLDFAESDFEPLNLHGKGSGDIQAFSWLC